MTKFTQLGAAGLAFIATSFMAGPASADILHNNDVIIRGGSSSLCVGSSCANPENFGNDTIRLKEFNLRLHFDDIGGSASNDWRILINDTFSGGANYFAIEDDTAQSQVDLSNTRGLATAPYIFKPHIALRPKSGNHAAIVRK